MAKKEKKLEPKKEAAHDAPQKEDKVKKIEKKKKNDKPSKAKPVENKVIAKKIPVVKKEKATDLNKATKKDPLTTISDFLWSVKAKHLPDVLFDLMTEKEIQEFAERIAILRQLQKWITQRVIAKNLGISVTTVSRWSKVLQTGKERIKKYL
jgi:Trp operon repressor